MKFSQEEIKELKIQIPRDIIHFTILNSLCILLTFHSNPEYIKEIKIRIEEFKKLYNLEEKNSPISNKAN